MNPLTNPTAHEVDVVLILIFGTSLLLLAGITATMIWFVIRYRRSKNPVPTSDVHHSLGLETLWTVLPTVIVLVMFWYGWVNYLGLREVPQDALEIKAIARMWSWQFQYENGRTSPKLIVPAGQAIKIELTSKDVIHSFFMPAFRIKRDAVPGMESYVWFKAPAEGNYDIFCAEYCGTGHADMITTAEVLPPAEFAAWLKQSGPTAAVPRGRQLLEENGCLGCHSLDGTPGIGPSLNNLKAHEQTPGVDAEHIRRAIREPNIEVAPGYQPIMPAFGKDQISDEDLKAITDYLLETQEEKGQAEPDAHELMENNGCLGCHSTDGSPRVGPTFKGITEHKVVVEHDGKKVELNVDADYLRRSIRQPGYDVVEGYPAIMPTFDKLSDEEIDAIVKELLKM